MRIVSVTCMLNDILFIRIGGGCFLALKDFERMFDHLFSACALFVVVVESSQ